ncbi:MAG: hypothetical protein SH850_10275 [Planctomycetaceae bacterium]|nr:hypothetical protein [Planctomycetaceae bacterium]
MSPCSAHCRRRGAALVMAIVTIAVVTAVAAALVQLAVAQRKQFEAERRHSQAEWYAEAGLDRAVAALEKSADYTGESWTIDEEATGRKRTATVVIAVQRDRQPPQLTVVAEYPVGELHRSRSRRELTLVQPRGATAVSALQPENRLP